MVYIKGIHLKQRDFFFFNQGSNKIKFRVKLKRKCGEDEYFLDHKRNFSTSIIPAEENRHNWLWVEEYGLQNVCIAFFDLRRSLCLITEMFLQCAFLFL